MSVACLHTHEYRFCSIYMLQESFVRLTPPLDMLGLVFRIFNQWFWTKLLSLLRWIYWKPASGDTLDSSPSQTHITDSPGDTISSVKDANEKLSSKPATDGSSDTLLQACISSSNVQVQRLRYCRYLRNLTRMFQMTYCPKYVMLSIHHQHRLYIFVGE